MVEGPFTAASIVEILVKIKTGILSMICHQNNLSAVQTLVMDAMGVGRTYASITEVFVCKEVSGSKKMGKYNCSLVYPNTGKGK